MFARVKQFFSNGLSTIGRKVSAAAQSAVKPLVQPVVQEVQSQVTHAVSEMSAKAQEQTAQVVDAVQTKAAEAAKKVISDVKLQAFAATEDLVKKAKQGVTNAASEMIDDIPLTIGKKIGQKSFGLFSSLLQDFGSAGDKQAAVISEKVTSSFNSISMDAGNNLNGFFSNLINMAGQFFKTIFTGFINFLFGSDTTKKIAAPKEAQAVVAPTVPMPRVVLPTEPMRPVNPAEKETIAAPLAVQSEEEQQPKAAPKL